MIIDSINEALSRGASPDQIIQKIKESNPQKSASFDEAVKRGADSKMILDQIIKQNTKAPEKETVFNQSSSATDTSAGNAFGVGDAITQGVIGTGKSVAETLMTPAKKLSQIQETLGARNIAKETSKGLEELTRQDNLMTEKYMKMSPEDPGREKLREMIKGNRAEMAKLSKGLSAEQEIGSVTDERFKSLEATNKAQAVGKFVGDVAQFIAGGKAKYPSIASKVPLVSKVTNTANELSRLNKAGELNKLGQLADKAVKITKAYLTSSAKFAPITASTGEGDLKEIATDSAVAGIFGAAGEAFSGISKILPNTAQKLEEWNLRLTPSQRANYGEKIKRVTDFLTKKGYQGTPTMRYSSVVKDYDKTEDIFQAALAEAKNSGITISKKKLIDSLIREAKNAAQDNSEASAVIKEFKRAIKNINYQYKGDVIPVDRLNSLKRSAFKNAVDDTGLEVLNDVRFRIANKYYDEIKEILGAKGVKIGGKSITEFNREYQDLIMAKTLLKAAQFRNQIGTFNRLVAAVSGTMSGSNLFESAYKGTVAHTVLNSTATPARAAVAKLLTLADEVGIENLPKGVAELVMYLKNK